MGDLLEGMLGGHLVWWIMINLPRASPEWTSNYSNSSREALAGHQHPSEVSQEEQFLTVPGVVGHRGHTPELKRRLPQAHLPAQKSDVQCQAWGEWPQLQKTPLEMMPLESLPNKAQELLQHHTYGISCMDLDTQTQSPSPDKPGWICSLEEGSNT